MRIVYFGNNPRGAICLKTLIKAKHDVIGVVLHHNTSNPTNSVYQIAKENNLLVFSPQIVNSQDFCDVLRSLNPDLFILSGYNQIINNNIISIPNLGAINLHGGRLPNYKGGSPINWQIINGETEGACTILFVDEGIDTGDIICEESFSIGPNETAGEIQEKVLQIFPSLLLIVLDQIKEGTVEFKKQNHLDGIYYCKRYPSDGYINWQQLNAVQIHNLVRGLNGPNLPGAFTYLNDQKITVWRTKLIEEAIKGVPGRIALKKPEGVVVIAKDKGILITEILDSTNAIVRPHDILKIKGWAFK